MNGYRTYRDSGIDWLGEIPSHWKLEKFKYIFSERVEKNSPKEAILTATQTKGVLPKSLSEICRVTPIKALENLKLVRVGDFVISLRSFQGGIEYAYFQGIISPAYTILENRSKSIHSNYLKHFLKSDRVIQLLNNFTIGIRDGKNIQYRGLREELLPVPPLAEQQAIAEYLDRESDKIDELEATLEQNKQLLKNYKKALIFQTVMRGLHSSIPLKASDIEWMGQIPAHWDVAVLKKIAKFKTGNTPPRKFGISESGEFDWIKPSDITENQQILDSKEKISRDAIKRCGSTLFPIGTILFVSIASIGKIAILTKEAYSNQQITAISIKGQHPNYYLYFLLGIIEKIKLDANEAVVSILNTKYLKNIDVLLPPLSEQKEIANFLARESGKIDAILQKIETQIELVKKYRRELISKIVTGKLSILDR